MPESRCGRRRQGPCSDRAGPRGGRSLPRARQQRRAVREEAARSHELDVVVRLERVGRRSRCRQRRANVEQAITRVVADALRSELSRGPAHERDQLRVVELRTYRPDPGERPRHERGRIARAARDDVTGWVVRAGHGDFHVDTRAGEIDRARRARERRDTVVPVGGSDRQHVWISGRVGREVEAA